MSRWRGGGVGWGRVGWGGLLITSRSSRFLARSLLQWRMYHAVGWGGVGLIMSCSLRSLAQPLLQWRTCHAVRWGVVWCGASTPFLPFHTFAFFAFSPACCSSAPFLLFHTFVCWVGWVGASNVICMHFASEHVCLQFHRCVKAAYFYLVSFVLVGVRFIMPCLRTVGELMMVLAFEFVTLRDVSFRFTCVRCMLRHMMSSWTQQVWDVFHATWCYLQLSMC